MIHNKIEVKSGNYQLQKMTKTQVRVAIKGGAPFHGFLCGNRVNPYHIADGWCLGMRIDPKDIDDFEQQVSDFETSLTVYTPELGQYPHFYQILEEN